MCVEWDVKTLPRNDLLCVEWDVKLYTHSLGARYLSMEVFSEILAPLLIMLCAVDCYDSEIS